MFRTIESKLKFLDVTDSHGSTAPTIFDEAMRFNKGTEVEVLTKSSVPSGAWRSAEIVSGNGHYYTVMYDDGTKERVSRKSMRPEPPLLQVLHSWRPGDVLEVFESCSWKIAIVSRNLEDDYLLVRLLGSSLTLRANKSDVRVRQSWQDNQWIMVGKVLKEKENEDDRESIASSVGSCSMDIDDGLSSAYFGTTETGNSSDTESSSCGYRSIKKMGFPAADVVHRLELDAYRSSIERLYASGPNITWEQETWITNLRLRLNISNEEHLMQLRNLISEDNSTTYR